MKTIVAVLALLPFVAQAGDEHKGTSLQPTAADRAGVAHASAVRHTPRNAHWFDQVARFVAKHGRTRPGRCSA
jgi:hypothetical protein